MNIGKGHMYLGDTLPIYRNYVGDYRNTLTTAGLMRCPLRRTTRLLSTETDADVDSHLHSETETQPLRGRERSVNQVTLLGRLGSDPSVVEKEDGRKYAIFPLALNERFRNTQTDKLEQSTVWVKILAFSPTPINVAERLEKGDRVFVQGKIMKHLTSSSEFPATTAILSENLIRVSRPRRSLEKDDDDET